MNHRRKNWGLKLAVVSCVSLGGAIASAFNCAFAQSNIAPDNSLGAESSVVTPNVNIKGIPSEQIDGGAIRGANLFHSFREFNINQGRGAYFTNPAGVENIISRVTGGNSSNIQGTLGVLGNANLFLINPSGIIFGRGARLDVGGSFVATTASSLKLADGTEFSAETPANTPLLTVSVPMGLQFGRNAGEIRNQSQGTNSSGVRVGLQVQPGKTLALVGGDVTLTGGYATAPRGRIELGSVAGVGLVSLNPTNNGYALGYDGVPSFGDIALSQGAVIDASGNGGGNIQVLGRRVSVLDGSQIAAKTLGSGLGGTLNINASQELVVSGESANPQDYSRLTTRTEGSGAAGKLTITTGKFIVQDGGQVSAGTVSSSQGNGGTLTVNASDSVEVKGASADKEVLSRLTTRTDGGGDAGDMTITTPKLVIQQGGEVSTGALSETKGVGGNLTVNARDSVELSGFTISEGKINPSRLTSRTEGACAAGDTTITTSKLVIQDGAQVSAGTVFGSQGKGGNLTINASDSVEVNGFTRIPDANNETILSRLTTRTEGAGAAGDMTITTPKLVIRNGGQVSAGTLPASKGAGGNLTVNARDSVEVTGKVVNIAGESVSSRLTNRTENDKSTGNLKITTGKLIVRDGAEVGVNSRPPASGQPGNLEVTARSILLDNEATLNARSESVDGGNISLQVQDLLVLRRNSQISATAGLLQGAGNGGNIIINAPNGFIIAVPTENSDIAANAFTGKGGRVEITAQGILGLVPRSREELQTLLGTNNPNRLNPARLPSSDITAISRTNPSLTGTVTINTPDIDPTRGLITLPTEPVQSQLAAGCASPSTNANSFIVTGRGGLPDNPRESFEGNTPLVDWVTLNRGSNNNSPKVSENSPSPTPEPIVEATSWRINDKGEVILIADASAATWHPESDCTPRNSQMH